MLKKIFLFLFVFLFICSVGSIIVSAEETTTEQITEAETVTEPVTESVQIVEHNLDDIYDILFYVLIGIGVVGGCLIAQGFSFWKW